MAARLRHQGFGKPMTLGFGGDVDVGGLIDQCLEHHVKDRASEDAARRLCLKHPLLARGMRSPEVWGNCVGALQADVSVVSLLSPFTFHPHRSRSSASRVIRASHPMNAEVLQDANLDVCVLGNQFSMGYQQQGLQDTRTALEEVNIKCCGAGTTRAASLRPAIINQLGRQIAIFSISAAGSGVADAEGLDMFAADDQRGGVAYVDLWDGRQEATLERMRDAVEAARAASRISIVIFSVCWGGDTAVARTVDGRRLLTAEVPQQVRAFARGLIDVAGAHVVHGHGLQHLCGVELHCGRPILYSCGTLVGDGGLLSVEAREAREEEEAGRRRREAREAEAQLRPELSAFFTLHISGSHALEYLEVTPLCSRLLQTSLASGKGLRWVQSTLQHLCAELGTRAIAHRDRLYIPITAQPPQLPSPRRAPRADRTSSPTRRPASREVTPPRTPRRETTPPRRGGARSSPTRGYSPLRRPGDVELGAVHSKAESGAHPSKGSGRGDGGDGGDGGAGGFGDFSLAETVATMRSGAWRCMGAVGSAMGLPIVGRARVGGERRPALAEEDAERTRGAKGTEADEDDEEATDTCAPLSPLPAWEKRWAGPGKPVSTRVPLSPNRASSPPSPSIRGYSPLRRGGQGVQTWNSDVEPQGAEQPGGALYAYPCDQFV